ncbi:hypothetical protein V8D89_006700 [Ganoderma adspersum]
MAPSQSILSLLQSVVSRPQMENAASNETVQSTEHGWMFTEHDILLSRSVSFILQSILFAVFVVTHQMARSAIIKRSSVSGSLRLERGDLVHLTALLAMLFLSLVNMLMSLLDSRPIAGYEGKLDAVAYKTVDDRYFLFMSVCGIQFYLYMAQTVVANWLAIYTFYAKSTGYPKTGSYAIRFSILGTIFGCCAFANPEWAFQFLSFSAAVNFITLIPVMRASLRDSNVTLVNFLCSRGFYDIVIQSAAVYRVASLSLLVTLVVEPNVLFYPNISVLSPLMGIAFSLAAAANRGGTPADGAIQLPQDDSEMEAALDLVEKGPELEADGNV